MKENKYFLFDFDGTLVDSFQAIIDKTRLVAEQFGFKKIEDHEIEGLREMTSMELVRHLQVPLLKIPRVIQALRQHLLAEMPALLPVPGLLPVLAALHQQGIPLAILTSNGVENVSSWLEQQKLSAFFKEIISEDAFFSKARSLRKVLKDNALEASQVFYIGDETRDLEAAKEAGVIPVGVTWGFQSEAILSKHHPQYLLHRPEELLALLS